MRPFISICVPAFKNQDYLQVLLQSIASQTFNDFEVIITDDSPTNELEEICNGFGKKFPLQYFRNTPAKGSPGNWNEGISKASGTWIKMMHDDDWFATDDALEKFAEATQAEPDIDFIFSGYNSYEQGRLKNTQINSKRMIEILKKNPYCLFLKNYIGHPSTTLIKNNRRDWYDPNTKWVVDFEFYIRCIKSGNIFYIPTSLVNIGINNEQITKQVFRNKSVEIPENLYLLNKLGTAILTNIIVYDYYWRMFRNLNIRSVDEVMQHANQQVLPKELKQMLQFQIKISLPVLKVGVCSKILMTLSYIKNRLK